MTGVTTAPPTSVGTVGVRLRVDARRDREHDRFLLTAHEGPDGDALGSLLGMHRLLQKLGKDSVMFLAAKEFPLRSSTASCLWRRSSTRPPPTWRTG